ncbi:hypothetical protein F6V25_16190 [Oryzomonas japonica]|uniref:Uncharacterized protein n=1 Tax=Oryzomonas japonica TaxID=2603858 RepID=A0A7J4ZLV6_9BACT|nr:hypothetical protein [Oryzomonas japonica]KAB0663615.1 hypothetical protein F6V25_16190 [Oryzomonas japonica]
MQINKLSMMLLGALSCAVLLNGCGASSKEAGILPSDVPKVDEALCAQCHGSSYNAQSGMPIYSEYVQSKHFKNSVGEVIGCQDCHGGGSQHNGVGPMPYPNPDTAGRCWACHQPAFIGAFGTPTAAEVAHFQNITSYRVQYINPTSADTTRCTFCHEPHNPDTGLGASERKAWAASDHGDVAGAAWVPSSSHKWLITGGSEDFSQVIPASDCLRCHTADGFVQFTKSNFTSVANLPGDPKVNSALKCDACHYNDSFSVRGVNAVSTFYNVNMTDKVTAKVVQSHKAAKFPDVGHSNICISCHSGRVAGPNLTEMFATGNWNLSNASFQNSHYMAAAGTMYMEVGFKNFTTLTAPAATSNEGATFASTRTYNQTLSALNTTTPDGVALGQNSAHRRLGTPLIANSEDYLTAAGDATAIASNGPCVTCHMKAYNPVAGNGFTPPAAGRPGAGHSLQIDEATAEELCLQCHADAPHLDGGTGTGTGNYTTMKTLADMEKAMLEPQSTAFQNGLTLVKQLLLIKYAIKYDGTAYPYFFDMQKDATGKTAITDWTRKNVAGVTDAAVAALGNANITVIPTGGLTQVQAYRLMGACYNLNVLARDPGAYLHARTYSQRVVYDTVDYLDNNKMDFTSLTTARAMTAASVAGLAGVYTGYDVNVLNPTPGASGGSTVLAGTGLATESMAWLAGTHYTDTKGTTPTPLRLRP